MTRPRSYGDDLRKRAKLSGAVEVRTECGGKFGFALPCWPDCWGADLRVCRGWGYVIAVETNTIALDDSGVTRRLGPTEASGPFRSSTLALGLAVGRA